jgi:tRNA(Arg) A34 adenosine deaminase TadA
MGVRPEDETYLLRAIELARISRAKGNQPFGSLLVDVSGQVVVEAENTVVTEQDVTGHAELNLVRSAGLTLGASGLLNATLYASTEPCAMCSGAIYWSGIGRVVYGLSTEALMAIVNDLAGSGTLALSCREVFARGGRSLDVSGPHLEKQASAVHEGFWN